jgi:hypothetical protein
MRTPVDAEDVLYHEVILPSRTLVQSVSIGMGVLFLLAFAAVPISPWLTGSIALMALVFTWWMRVTKLVSKVSKSGLSIRMAPFPTHFIPVSEIEGWRVHMTYPWGVRHKGWAVKKAPGVTVFLAGDQPGLVIGLSGQKGIWLSSARPDEIASALSRIVPKRRGADKKGGVGNSDQTGAQVS